MSHVRFRGVTKRYGRVVALNSLDLEIEEGEFVSLLGPSGSGKSTTLNLLAGLAEIDEGDVTIGDVRVNDLPPDRRDIAMVFQNYALYPHMTVFENIAFPLRAKGRRVAETDIRSRIDGVARILGVQDLLARYPRELSGGQQQRVALGRAMVRDPKVFLLDEPLSNLDARLRIRMRHDIKALHERIGSTIVYVTHDQAEAMTLSSRIAVFSTGRLQQYASPAQIYNRPTNMFVANFVGEREVNFLKGRVRIESGEPVVDVGGAQVHLGDSASSFDLAQGRQVVLGIRAEGIQIEGEGATMEGVIDQLELVGPDLIVYVMFKDQILSCRADPSTRLAKGEAVRMTFVPRHIHLFDPDTTASLRTD